jgi:hypothetical protein
VLYVLPILVPVYLLVWVIFFRVRVSRILTAEAQRRREDFWEVGEMVGFPLD